MSQILAKPLSERFAGHKAASDKVKKAIADLGLKQVAAKPDEQAHGMTAIYLPEGVKGADLLPILAKKGVVFAGGIHKEIVTKYIRFGHMGVSVVSTLLSSVESGKVPGSDINVARFEANRYRPCYQGVGGGIGRVWL
jgi:alanine-glyoxylate transaminase/serine-glyoxylate transaminase/serine-pyruvate transaminase